ncbi:MAG: phosphopantetheine-binding protein, partial [Microcystaceae cyanobacterium]
SNYVSEKTKIVFEKALQNGYPVKSTANQLETIPITPSILSASRSNTVDTAQVTTQQTPNPKIPARPEIPLNFPQVLGSLEYSLAQFNQHQGDTLQVHGQYLDHQREYARTFFQLMQLQNSLFSQEQFVHQSAPTKLAILESAERSMMKFHEHQAGTLNVHEQYLNHQVEYTKSLFQLTQQGYSILLAGELTQAEPLSLSYQDDSVALSPFKLGADQQDESIVTSQNEPITKLENGFKHNPQPVSNGAKRERETLSAETESDSPVIVAPLPSLTIDVADLSQTLLAVVSEKTGYPAEMLVLDMDLEADLGIDSIKRVEILGALQERYPDLSKPNLEELAEVELRTLGHIVEYM